MTVPDQPGGGWGGSRLRADHPPEVGPLCSPITRQVLRPQKEQRIYRQKRLRPKRLEGVGGWAASVDGRQERIVSRLIRRGRRFRPNFTDGGQGRRDSRSRCQRQQDLADAALLWVVTLRRWLAGSSRMVLGCPKVIPGKGMRAIVMAASALTRCSPVRLGALGQVRTPDHARRLKGEDAEHKPVHDRLHGS